MIQWRIKLGGLDLIVALAPKRPNRSTIMFTARVFGGLISGSTPPIDVDPGLVEHAKALFDGISQRLGG